MLLTLYCCCTATELLGKSLATTANPASAAGVSPLEPALAAVMVTQKKKRYNKIRGSSD